MIIDKEKGKSVLPFFRFRKLKAGKMSSRGKGKQYFPLLFFLFPRLSKGKQGYENEQKHEE